VHVRPPQEAGDRREQRRRRSWPPRRGCAASPRRFAVACRNAVIRLTSFAIDDRERFGPEGFVTVDEPGAVAVRRVGRTARAALYCM
jgi:hypothetical protein